MVLYIHKGGFIPFDPNNFYIFFRKLIKDAFVDRRSVLLQKRNKSELDE